MRGRLISLILVANVKAHPLVRVLTDVGDVDGQPAAEQ